MKPFQLSPMKSVLFAIAAVAGGVAAQAQYTNYFTNQVFSTGTVTPAPQGTFNGGTYAISNPGNATITTWQSVPGALPSGANYPASGTVVLALHSGGAASKTITVTPSTPLTPADHIYIEDLDNAESATFRFYAPVTGTLMSVGSFRAVALSSNVNSDFSITKNSNDIAFIGGANTQTQPLLEIIPNAPVGYFTITFSNPNAGGSFGFFMGRNIPVLSHSLSSTSIPRGHSSTLTYTLSGINNNPVYNLGFTNNLPSGLKVAAVPATTGTQGTFAAAANGSTVTLSAMTTAFSATTPVTSASWSVQISNADGQMNSSCGSNPAAFTNRSTNYVTSSTELSNTVAPVCMMVVAPLPLELSSFTAAAEGCAAILSWETAYESRLAGYEVERSQDGQRWTRAGQVAAGNKGIAQQYTYRDEQAPQGALQYRLRILDLGGAAALSHTAMVRNACAGTGGSFAISPNPARTAFSCSFAGVPAAGAAVVVYLSDLAGRVVATLPATSRSGASAGFSLPQLPAGLYILQASVDGQPSGTGKLLVQ